MLIGQITSVSGCEVMIQVIKVVDDDRQDLWSISLDKGVLYSSAPCIYYFDGETYLGVKV